MSAGDDLTKYVPAAWRAYQNLDQIRSLQERASPHIDALMAMAPEARALYAALFPEEHTGAPANKFTVAHLQQGLNQYGGAHLTVDGVYGEATRLAVEAYQRAHGLVVDGWAGLQTLGHLFSKIGAK